MANYRVDIVDIELNSGSVHRSFLNYTIGGGDYLANQFGFNALRNSQAENISGSVNGYFIRPDGYTVPINNGVISGNKAYITLIEECYEVEGKFTLSIKLTGNGVNGTIRIVEGVVVRTSTGAAVSTGNLIPSVESLITEIQEAVASVPDDYTALVSKVDNSASDSVQEWTPAPVADLVMGKSIISGVYQDAAYGTTDLRAAAQTYYLSGAYMKVKPRSGYKIEVTFYDESKTFIEGTGWITSEKIMKPLGKYYRITVAGDSDISSVYTTIPSVSIQGNTYDTNRRTDTMNKMFGGTVDLPAWITGKYPNPTEEEIWTGSDYKYAEKVRVVGGARYEYTGVFNSVCGVIFYDEDMNIISGAGTSDNVFTAPINACYMDIGAKGVDTKPVLMFAYDTLSHPEKLFITELPGAITPAGSVNPDTGARAVIAVKPNEKYLVSSYCYDDDTYPIVIFRNGDDYVSYLNLVDGETGYATDAQVTVPDGVDNMTVNSKPGEITIKQIVSCSEQVMAEEKSGVITPAGSVHPDTGARVEIPVKPYEKYLVSGYCYVPDVYPIVIFRRGSTLVTYDNIVSAAGYATDAPVYVPVGVDTMIVNSKPKQITVKKAVNNAEDAIEYLANRQDVLTTFRGKKIVWFGTSIPANGWFGYEHPNAYPQQVGRLIGAEVINEAIGSSCIHCKDPELITASNPYGFITGFEACSRCLTNTDEEMQWIIDNWDSGVWTEGLPTDMDEWLETQIHACGYEEKLDKYLTPATFPDLFVFDHGFNDSSDENDYYETYGTYSKYTFRGGMNFLIKRILDYNPYANIVIIGNYTTTRDVPEMQEAVAKDWALPICRQWEYLGLSTTQNVTANGYWDDSGAEYEWIEDGTARTYTMRDRLVPDHIHPHSNPTGQVVKKMALGIAKWLYENAPKFDTLR